MGEVPPLYWPREDVIGKRLRLGTDSDEEWLTVVRRAADTWQPMTIGGFVGRGIKWSSDSDLDQIRVDLWAFCTEYYLEVISPYGNILLRRVLQMAKSFKNLLTQMSPERRDRNEARAQEILKEINLRELRQAFALTQQQLAATLKINQAAISKMESQSDMYLSTLRRFLEAMGAHLIIVAQFPDGEVVINQFTQKDDQSEVRA